MPSSAQRIKTVFLDFDGRAAVHVGDESHDVPSLEFAGDRLAFAETVRQRMQEDFAWAGVTIMTSETDAEPPPPCLVVAFGGSHETYMGISSGTNAIVFLDWACDSEEQLAQAAANAGGHELGHLLGMAHSGDNPFDLMGRVTTPWIACQFDLTFIETQTWRPDARLRTADAHFCDR